MHLITCVLVMAESKNDAESIVRNFVEERIGERGIFDYGDIDEERESQLLSEVRDDLIKCMEHPEAELALALSEFDKYRAMGEAYTGIMGYNAKRIGQILQQDFTDTMPFFNMEEYDWSLPKHDEDGVDKAKSLRGMEKDVSLKWYAVPIDLHF